MPEEKEKKNKRVLGVDPTPPWRQPKPKEEEPPPEEPPPEEPV